MAGSHAKLAGMLVGAAAIGVFAGAAVVAWLHPDVDDSAIHHASETLPVTAPVELRSAEEMAPLGAVVSKPVSQAIQPRGGTGDRVVTDRALNTGTVIHTGDLVAEVAGEPIIAIPSTVPLYRDLAVGDRGNDIRLLETALAKVGVLNESPDALATERTRAAVNALRRRAGYPALPAGVVLLLKQTAPVPDGATITAAAQVGDTVDGDHPLITAETRGTVISARADLLAVRFLEIGAPVTVTDTRGRAAQTTVAEVSAFQEASSDRPAGHDVTIEMPKDIELAAGDSVTITVAASGKPQPSVPLTALRHDGAQAYVLVATDTDPTKPSRRVDVTVVAQSGGWAVLSDSTLTEGMIVVVRP